MQGTYPLVVNGSLMVPTRRPDLDATIVAGNLAQCKPVISSNQTTFPGQYPVAAVDSSNGTSWQPSLPSPAFIEVDLESAQSLSRVRINWGEVPAQSFEVLVSNSSSGPFTSVLQMDVEISAPYNETQALLVELVLGNTTDAQITANGRYDLVVLGGQRLIDRYVQLIVNGTYGPETSGATVSEFAIV